MKKRILYIAIVFCILSTSQTYIHAASVGYTVTYDTNGGNNDGPEPLTLPPLQTSCTLNNKKKPTHTKVDDRSVVFIGWTTIPNTTILLKDDAPITTVTKLSEIVANVIVYASWGYDDNNNGRADVLESKTVKFLNEKGVTISSEIYSYGSALTIPKDLQGTVDRNTYHTFMGWSPTIENSVTKDATYTPLFVDGTFEESNVVTDLQTLIDTATVGSTIRLEEGKIYKGDIIISKQIKITSDASSIIDGKISIPTTVSGTGEITIEKCVIEGGIEVSDGQANLSLFRNTIYYDEATPAFKVIGVADGLSKHFDRYTIGTTDYPNTFINEGQGDNYEKGISASLAIAWPFTTYKNGSLIAEDCLNVMANYWKKGDLSTDATFWDVKVTGDFGKVSGVEGRPTRWDGYVKYAMEYAISPRNFPMKIAGSTEGRILPPENFPWRVKYNTMDSRAINNTNDRIYKEDISLVLYNRSFKKNGTAAPYFLKMESYNAITISPTTFNGPQLPKPRIFEYLNGYLYKDSGGGSIYTNPEDIILSDGAGLYTSSAKPFLPMDVSPKTIVSYAGTGTLSKTFPTNRYEFKIENIYYDVNAKGISAQLEYLIFPESAYGLYSQFDAIIQGTNPLSTKIYNGSNELLSNAVGGKYSMKVINVDDIFGYHDWLDTSVFGTCYFDNDALRISNFKTNTPETDFIIRPTSGNLTVQPVAETRDDTGTNVSVAIDSTATYYDSTKGSADVKGYQIDKGQVSLLNDNEEPTVSHYKQMLDALNKNKITKNKAYKHHYLSLLNTNDGNNVVVTTSKKEVFMPYPKDYKEGSDINIMYFNDYHRMPSDTITTNTIITNSDITKLKTGFTFTTTSDLGAYVIAYEKKSSNEEDAYTLDFITNGGSEVAPITKKAGEKISINQTTTRKGYTFEGWFADENFKNPVTEIVLTSNKTVYAKWKESNSNPTIDPDKDSTLPQGKPEDPDSTTVEKTPETGDENNITIWITSLLVSGGILYRLMDRRRYSRRSE